MTDRDRQGSVALTPPAELAPRSVEDKRGARDIGPASAGASLDPRQTRAEPDWPPAVIAGAFQTGVLGVRSLTRRGVRAVCFDCNPMYQGFRSVYGPAHLCPDPDTDPDGWLRFMLGLAGKLGDKPALIASSDQFVSAIARHSTALAEHYILSPGIALQGLLADKPTQYELAARHGMPMPRTQFVSSMDEVAEFAQKAAFPCLMKPTQFREWRRFPSGHPLLDTKVAIARTPDSPDRELPAGVGRQSERHPAGDHRGAGLRRSASTSRATTSAGSASRTRCFASFAATRWDSARPASPNR